MFYPYNNQPSEPAGDGAVRKVLSRGGCLMMSETAYGRGAECVLHSHPHEQMSLIKKGKFRYRIGDEIMIMSEGDSLYCPPNTPHGAVALEDGIILDMFTPQREDLLRK